jgi:uncharacterized protein YecE (DUF72 family)
VGTSGWAYPEWRPEFYPEGLPRREFLAYYGRTLTACEINATFYRLQSEPAMGGWAAAVPEGFRFAVKAHRGVTHGAVFPPDATDDGLLARFLRSLGALGTRLGTVLVQLPPHRARDDAALERLLAALPRDPACALEFRHESWDRPEVAERIAAAGGTVCLADRDAQAPERLPPGPLAYVRLRADRYDDQAREAWRDLLVREASGRDVYVFARHEGVPAGDPHVGVGLAEWLVGATAGPVS